MTTTITDEVTALAVSGASLRIDGGPFRVQRLARLTEGSSTVRVALVPTSALLLVGDHVVIDVHVGSASSLEILEPGGTVAYAMRGGEASWDVRVRLDDGARLVWHGEPFIVSADARVRRSFVLDLTGSARAVVRETLVLGRAGEPSGRLSATTEVRRDGMPVLVEALETGPGRPGLGRHRVLDQVLHLGPDAAGCPADPATTLRLESGDLLHRRLGASTHASPVTVRACQSSTDE
jgi:urease accessory protein